MNKIYIVTSLDGVHGFKRKEDAEEYVERMVTVEDIDSYDIFIYETEVIKTYRILKTCIWKEMTD